MDEGRGETGSVSPLERSDRPSIAAAGVAMRAVRQFSRWLALAVFALAPLPFGSVETIWIASWCLLLAVSLATADYSRLTSLHLRIIIVIAAALAIYAGVAFLQMSGIVGIGVFDPMWERAGALLGEKLTPRISVSADGPLMALGPAILFVLVFLRALIIGTERDGAALIRRVIAWAALAYAIYSAAALLIDPTALLWREKEAYLSNLTGTFTNRNTAAAYFGSASVVWLLFALSELRRRMEGDLTIRQEAWLLLQAPPRAVIGHAAGALLCLCATAATASRAGLLLTTVAWIVACVFYFDVRSKRGFRLLIIAAIAAVITLELWGSGVAYRIDRQGLVDYGRLYTYRASLEIIADHPLLGIGLGNFEVYFPSRRPPELGNFGIWDRAHSTPLEIAVEMGLPVAGMIVLVWLWLAKLLTVASFRYGRSDTICALAVGLMGTLHSCIDFPLQIPGYAATFAALTAAGLARIQAPASRSPAASQVALGNQ